MSSHKRPWWGCRFRFVIASLLVSAFTQWTTMMERGSRPAHEEKPAPEFLGIIPDMPWYFTGNDGCAWVENGVGMYCLPCTDPHNLRMED